MASSRLRKLSSSSSSNAGAPVLDDLENIVYDIGEGALERALAKIGTRGLIFEEATVEADSFKDISQIIHTLPAQMPANKNSMSFLSSFLGGASIPDQTSHKTQFKTKVSWTETSCGCRNSDCTATAAIDPIGFINTANGVLRGRSPVAFIGDDGELLPCLKHSILPPIEELNISGSCRWTDDSFKMCADIDSGVNSTFSIPDLHKYRCVECSSENGGIDGLRIEHQGKLVARAINASEILSSGTNPNRTLTDELNDVDSFPDVKVNLGTYLGIPIEFDFTESAKDFLFGGLTTAYNRFFWSLSPLDFNSENPASNASIVEMTRAVDTVYHTQLGTLSNLGRINMFDKLQSLPHYVTAQIERPEASTVQEIVSGLALLLLASTGFGAILGTFLKNNKGRYFRSFGAILSVIGALLVLVLESVAFWLGWIGEVEHTQYSKVFVHMEVKGSKKFTFNPIKSDIDMKGVPFVVYTYMVELSDIGDNFEWIYQLGAIVAAIALVLSVIFGPTFQGRSGKGNKEEEKKDDVEENTTFDLKQEELGDLSLRMTLKDDIELL